MRELEPADPRRIGGYRLLRRLAEGRSGVVYLARSVGGTPTALKVVRAECAREPGHRDRFERDVAAARHVRARGLITVLAADTAGGTSWAAYPYLPGPSLAEAIAAHGPLPPRSVRALGAMLAEALRSVHEAGLAHRDVRPGHVLLAPDGPRLTGFGGSGTRTGPPGYLSPEHARGAGTGEGAGPAGDIFSLGCVLAFASGGRPPFGTGTAPELLLRVLHEPADLADVHRSLLEVVQACLSPDPVPRPTAADLHRELNGPGAGAGWLPGPLARQVAERYAAEPPRAQPPPPAPAAPPQAPAEPLELEPEPEPGSARRRNLLLLGAAATLGVAGLAGQLTGWQLPSVTLRNAVAGADRDGYRIGLHADLSGARSALGRGQHRGIALAVEELNALGELPFELTIRVVDDGGESSRAALAARELAADAEVMAVVGPTGDAVARAAAAVYSEAGVPLLALSVGTFPFHGGYGTLLHARPGTAAACQGIPAYLAAELGVRRIGLVDDRAADPYSRRTARAVTAAGEAERVEVVSRVLTVTAPRFESVAAELAGAGVDAVVYGGYAERAGRLARALRTAGFTGAGLATEEAIGPGFFVAAGDAADGWRFMATYTDSVADLRAQGFATVHRERFGASADPYAAEAYDAARLLAETMRGTIEQEHRLGRDALLSRLKRARYHGVVRELEFDAVGGYAGAGPMAYLYEARAGRFVFRGPAPYRMR